jgi:hypothetical protein
MWELTRKKLSENPLAWTAGDSSKIARVKRDRELSVGCKPISLNKKDLP